jgi:hypothetical protein
MHTNPDRAEWLGDPYVDERNHPAGFAIRTRKNLLFLEQARTDGADVHVVAQLVNSLLGVVVFPWEKQLVLRLGRLRLETLRNQGWPQWDLTVGTCDTLGQLIRKFRHAVAHGNVRFTSESRLLDEVFVEVANFSQPPAKGPPTWAARMRADRLREFCLRLIYLFECQSRKNAG